MGCKVDSNNDKKLNPKHTREEFLCSNPGHVHSVLMPNDRAIIQVQEETQDDSQYLQIKSQRYLQRYHDKRESNQSKDKQSL